MMATKEAHVPSSAYRNIMKATTLFGSVQLYHIVVSIIKSKIIAVLLGPAGVGVIGLFQAAIDLLKSLTGLGLSQSAVRDISEANGNCNSDRVSLVVSSLRKLVWLTGILGMLLMAFLSPFLSKMSFGNYDYTVSFIALSIILLFDQLCAGQKVILQGLRKLKDLAKASAIGSTFGLIVSIPLYYLLGIEGIVPTLILHSIASLIVSWYYSKNVKTKKVKTGYRQAFSTGRQMMAMGIAMSISSIMATLIGYLLKGYIRLCSNIEEVGLYQAGFSILTTYVGLVFSAIATDYYPRLAAVNKDNRKIEETVGQQGEIATMILAPMLCGCIIFMPFVLKILYSNKFLNANEYITIACFGMMFKLASWLVSFVFVAKAESKLFIINETTAKLYMLLFGIIGYKLYGLTGLGYAFVLQYIVYTLQVFLIANKKYDFLYTKDFIKGFLFQLIFVMLCVACVFSTSGYTKYIIGFILVASSLIYSVIELNNRLNILSLIKSKIWK